MKNKYLKRLTIILLIIVFLDNLPISLYLQGTNYITRTTQTGTNCDITNGAISNINNPSYIFLDINNDTIFKTEGIDKIILTQKETVNFGLFSFLPFYKKSEPSLLFDCHHPNTKKYLGQLEILCRIEMKGIFNRSFYKQEIINNYLNQAISILNFKSIPYNQTQSTFPFNDTVYSKSVDVGKYSSPHISITLSDFSSNFQRRLPIRQNPEKYVDTILVFPKKRLSDYPSYEIYSIDKPKKMIKYSSYNYKDSVIYSCIFETDENFEYKPHWFKSFTINSYNDGIRIK